MFLVVGVGAWAVTSLTIDDTLPPSTVVAISVANRAALAALTVGVTVVATYAAYRFRLDPDDVVIPVVTNTCDVLGVLVLFAVVEGVCETRVRRNAAVVLCNSVTA